MYSHPFFLVVTELSFLMTSVSEGSWTRNYTDRQQTEFTIDGRRHNRRLPSNMTTKAITFDTDYKSFTLYRNIVSTDKTSR
jgi:hypothetical protein